MKKFRDIVHYMNEVYKDIDISDVNLTEDEIQNKNREWTINEFSSEQVIFEKESDLVFNRWYADMAKLGIPIEWEDMI